jgi:hypothetical protein
LVHIFLFLVHKVIITNHHLIVCRITLVLPMLQLASVRFWIRSSKELGWITMVGAVFHQQLEESSNSNFLKASRTRGSIVWCLQWCLWHSSASGGECTSTHSSLFWGSSRLEDCRHEPCFISASVCCSVTLCMHGSGFVPYPIMRTRINY